MTPDQMLSAMTAGVRAHAALLTVMLPRVAPEVTIVGAAAHGLIDALGTDDWRVRIEQGKRDLVIEHPESGQSYWFEFKLLWSNGGGPKEFMHLIAGDANKMAGADNAFHVAVAYAIDEVPPGQDKWRTRKTRDETVALAEELVPAMRNATHSDVLELEGNGMRGSCCLLMWPATVATSV